MDLTPILVIVSLKLLVIAYLFLDNRGVQRDATKKPQDVDDLG